MDMADFEIGPLKASLQIQIRNQQQLQIAVLKDQQSGKVFQCTLAVLQLLQQIPARMSAKDFVQLYPRQEQDMLLTILRQALAHCLLQHADVISSQPQPRWYQRDWLLIKLGQMDSVWLIAMVRPLYQQLFCWPMFGLLLLGYCGAGWQLWQHSQQFWSQFYLFTLFQNWLWVYCLLMLSTCCHELGHAYCCHRYGGKVSAIGLALYFGQLAAYADVTDAWLMPVKWQRIKVALAGVYVEAFLTLIALWGWLLLPLGSVGSQIAFLFFVVVSSRICLNLLPFLRLDGYWVLSDWLEEPNLRSRAAAFSLYLLPALHKHYQLTFRLESRLQWVYLLFSLGSLLLAGLALHATHQAFQRWLPQPSWLPDLLFLLMMLLFLLSLGLFYLKIFQRYFIRRCQSALKEM